MPRARCKTTRAYHFGIKVFPSRERLFSCPGAAQKAPSSRDATLTQKLRRHEEMREMDFEELLKGPGIEQAAIEKTAGSMKGGQDLPVSQRAHRRLPREAQSAVRLELRSPRPGERPHRAVEECDKSPGPCHTAIKQNSSMSMIATVLRASR